MQQYSADLLALYAAAPTTKLYRAHLYMIGPTQNGSMIYATDGESPISYDGNVYRPSTYGFWSRGTQTIKIGFESNSIELTLFADSDFIPMYYPGTNNDVLLMDGVFAGLLSGAAVTVYRATMSTYGVVVGPTGGSLVSTRFVGEGADITALGPTKCTVKVNDLMYRLNLSTPRMLIQAPCRWVLYSQGCTLLQNTFTVTGAIGGIVDPRTFQTAAHLTTISPAGTFSKGILIFTSGANNGIKYFVSLWTPGSGMTPDQIQLDTEPLFDMEVGDTFTVTEGCNHTFSSCLNLQGSTNSVLNYGGAGLFTPVPETAI